jgi:hypothetical protein
MTVTRVEATSTHSIKLHLSNGSVLLAISAGGDSNAVNAANRDVLVEALQQTIKGAK